jgi:aspartate/methionine/tyrosine aminotransferase
MYLFPQVHFSQKAIDAAEKAGKKVDELYCMELLNETGVCVVPGSGFLQRDGTWHFRSTFLAPEDEMEEFARNLAEFHKKFTAKYK